MIYFVFVFLCVQDQELQDRLRDLERKVEELEKRQVQTTSANPLTVLNPRFTVIGNFLGRLDDRTVVTETGDEIDDTFNVREVELDLRASIDPYADGLAIISLESEVPGVYEVGVEEMYATIKSLPVPFWEEPPLGAKLKIGRFRTELGRNNRLHLHDLPQSDRPLVIEELFGEEGHVANGLSAQFFLPSPGDTALELTLQALQGGDIAVAEDPGRPAFIANLRWFVPLDDEHSFDVSLIGLYGTSDEITHSQSRVASADFLYRWKPLRQGDSQSFVAGGQVFYASHEAVTDTTPFGFYAWAQLQVSKPLYAGVRWDRTDFLDDDTDRRRRITPYVSYYLSEFFRVRASYQHTWSEDLAEDGLDTFMLEFTVIFGAHPTEPFWVNR